MSSLWVYLWMLVASVLMTVGAYRVGYWRGVREAAPIAYQKGRKAEREDNEKEGLWNHRN